MPAVLLKGAEIAQRIKERLRMAVSQEAARYNSQPALGLVKIGTSADADLYANTIRRVAVEVGVRIFQATFDGNEPETNLEAEIRNLGHAKDLCGLLLLSPVPNRLNYERLCESIPPDRDVECAQGFGGKTLPGVYPPTALAVMELLGAAGVYLEGKEAVVIGRSRIVGQPVAKLLLDRNATVTLCHSKTRDLKSHVERADILVAAAGQKGLVKGGWIKKGALVIDAGENIEGKTVTGDIEFEAAEKRAAFITPVPGGVGPLTPWMLVQNLVLLLQHRPL